MRRRWLFWVSAVWFVLAFAAPALASWTPWFLHSFPGIVAYLAALGGAPISLVLYAVFTKKRHGRLEVVSGTASLDGRHRLARKDLLWVALDPRGAGARLTTRGRLLTHSSVCIDVGSVAEGRALLWALSKAVDETARFQVTLRGAHALRERIVAWGVSVLLVPLMLVGIFVGVHTSSVELVCAAAIGVFAAVLLLLRWGPRTVILAVGVDGIVVRRLGRRQVPTFLPYSDVVDVAVDEKELVLTLRAGTVFRFEANHFGRAGAKLLVGMHAHILAAKAASDDVVRGASPDLGMLLARGDHHDASEWQRSLDALLRAPATYRTAPVPEEHLWRVFEDATQSPEMRAGAAVALRSIADEAGKLRLRVATAASASHHLRRVVEAATGEDDDELVLALGALEAPDGAVSRIGGAAGA